MINMKKKQMKCQKGATMIEYALIVGAIVAVAAVYFGSGDNSIKTAMEKKLGDVATELNKK